MEQEAISGIAYGPDQAKITIVGLPDRRIATPFLASWRITMSMSI